MARRRRPPRPGALADVSPVRILTQIAMLQGAYYVSAAVLMVFTALVAGQPLGVDLLLNWETLRGDTTVGWMYALVWLLNSLISVIYLLIFIARSKLVLDFALTLHFLHFLATALYSHAIPTVAFWWGVQFCSAGLMTWLGIWTCQWRELKPIAFGGRRADPDRGAEPVELGDEEDPEEGFSRGRGRGRGRDGAGEYEMVGMVSSETRA